MDLRPGLLVAMSVAASLHALAQTPAVPSPWRGWMQCQVALQGGGYSNRQTHTWTIDGPPVIVGAIAEYPATWTVSGNGALQGTNPDQTVASEWTTNGSRAGARIGIFVRASDGRLVALFRTGQLSVAAGTTGAQQVAALKAKAQTRTISQTISEWRPVPVIEDAADSTRLAGSNSFPITTRLDAMQPAGATGQTVCAWDFARSPSTPAPVPQSGDVATSPATRPPTIATLDKGTAALAKEPVSPSRFTGPSPRTITLAGFIAAGTGTAVALRTIAVTGFTAAGTATAVAPRTIAVTGFTAAGTATAVAPRTLMLPGWTSAGPAGRGAGGQ